MKKKFSITENGNEKSKVKKFFQKDFSQAVIFAIPMLFLAVFLLYPLFMTLLRAFWTPTEGLEFSGWSLEGFKQFFTSNLYMKSLKNSFIVSISVTFFSLLIGIPMGYFVARVKIPCKKLIL